MMMKNINIPSLTHSIFSYVIIGIFLLGLSACTAELRIGCLKPDGTNETRTIVFEEFEELSIDINAIITVESGTEQSVIIEAPTNVLDRIIEDSGVRNNHLNLSIDGCTKNLENEDIKIDVIVTNLEELKMIGNGELTTLNGISSDRDMIIELTGNGSLQTVIANTDDLEIELIGNGNIDVEAAEIGDLNVSLTGNGNIKIIGFTGDDVASELIGNGNMILKGNSLTHLADASGNGLLDFADLATGELTVDLIGDGDALLQANEKLDIEIDGNATIRSTGTADLQDIEVIGNASIFNFELISQQTKLDIIGNATLQVHAEQLLAVEIVGNADVCYKGNPTINQEITGNGTVQDCN